MKVFIAGHNGMVGSAIYNLLSQRKDVEIVTRNRKELDLLDQVAVKSFIKSQNFDTIIIAAARVGGIHANSVYPAEFIYQNIQIQNNIIHYAHLFDVQNILFLGSSCIYPKLCNQPISEYELLSGKLEESNEPYAIAKIAGIKMCESYNRQYGRDYRSIMPTNLYGPGDNFNINNSHVIPALIRKFHDAKLNLDSDVKVWGSGRPRREFLHVQDMACASLHIMDLPENEYQQNTQPMLSHINIGTGNDCSISDLAEIIKNVVGYKGNILFDTSKPDGTPRKLLDVTLLTNLGWQSTINLNQGIADTYKWFCENNKKFRDD
ncbi:GDP-L-fucose synthase [Gammaproteobacteria bacterium]|nr:GDP-L-fucose synthase [Gammaproteobacteria bacterium]